MALCHRPVKERCVKRVGAVCRSDCQLNGPNPGLGRGESNEPNQLVAFSGDKASRMGQTKGLPLPNRTVAIDPLCLGDKRLNGGEVVRQPHQPDFHNTTVPGQIRPRP